MSKFVSPSELSQPFPGARLECSQGAVPTIMSMASVFSQQWTIKTYPDKRPQTAWGRKRIIDDDDDGGDDDDDLPSGIFKFLMGTYG